LGVTPFGVDVEVLVLLPHPGNRSSVPPTTNRASTPQAFRDRLPPAAAPTPANASRGKGNHRAEKPLTAPLPESGRVNAPVVTGPKVLIEMVEVAVVPFTGTGLGLNEHIGGMVTNGVMDEHDRVTPPFDGEE